MKRILQRRYVNPEGAEFLITERRPWKRLETLNFSLENPPA
jgi:hypothetical protein